MNKNFEQVPVTGNTNPGLIAMRTHAGQIEKLNHGRQFTPAYGKKTRTMESRILACGTYVKESDCAESIILVLKTLDLVEVAMNPNGIESALDIARQKIDEKCGFSSPAPVKAEVKEPVAKGEEGFLDEAGNFHPLPKGWKHVFKKVVTETVTVSKVVYSS